MNWYLDVLKKYAVFNGRSRRQEYWMFILFNFIISSAISFIGNILHLNFLTSLYALAVFIPVLAVTTRRLHDIGKSGFYIFLVLIPLIGSLILLYFMCIEGEAHANKYGLNPKEDPFTP